MALSLAHWQQTAGAAIERNPEPMSDMSDSEYHRSGGERAEPPVPGRGSPVGATRGRGGRYRLGCDGDTTAVRNCLVPHAWLVAPSRARSGYTGSVEFRLQRVLQVTTSAAHATGEGSRRYLQSRTPAERLAAVEFLRRQHGGTGARLRRVLRLVDRTRG